MQNHPLEEITPEHFQEIRQRHLDERHDALNDKIQKLFHHFPDNTNLEDVRLKASVINSLYNTNIRYIDPSVRRITTVFEDVENGKSGTCDDIDLVDLIAETTWEGYKNKKTERKYYLSFASKFMHFQSGRVLPIYDSYIWLVMVGYLRRRGLKQRFANPKTYRDFYKVFCTFKESYGLSDYSNYDVDKFLWQYGMRLVDERLDKDKPDREKGRARLKKDLTAAGAVGAR